MALFSFLSRKKTAHLEVLLEIGSASVAGSLVVVVPGELSHIVYAIRKELPFQKDLDPKKLLIDAVAVTKKVCEELLHKGMPRTADFHLSRPKNIHVILSSPWYVPHLGHVSLGEKGPIVVSESIARDTVEEEAKRVLAEYNAEKISTAQVSVLEKRVIGMRLNGYPVTHISRQSVETASVTTYVSVVPRSVEKEISSAVGSVFHGSILFSSFTFFSYTVLRDLCEEIAHFSVFHVNGEVTDLAVINDGELAQVCSFPLGKNFIIRSLCHSTGVPPELCQSDVSVVFSGKMSPESQTSVSRVLEDAKKEWASVFESSLRSISQNTPIPHITIPLLDADIKPLFVDMFSKKATEKSSIPYLEMREISQEKIRKEVVSLPDVLPDSKMLLGALFLKRLVELRHQKGDIL